MKLPISSASEIKRVREKYGPWAILTQGDGHGECKLVQGPHGQPGLLLRKLGGGWTQQIRNADSWEGWYYGAMHVWGTGLCGHLLPAANIVKDITENTPNCCWSGEAIRRPLPGDSEVSSPAGSAISGRKSVSNRSIFARS